MILGLIDGTESVFLTLILKAASEDKSVSEALECFVKKERTQELLGVIQRFARSKLEHPILKLALEEMEALLSVSEEKKARYERK